jgi:hypothetical protein
MRRRLVVALCRCRQCGFAYSCGSHFTSNIAAGLMLEQFTRHLRSLPVDADICVNLRAGKFQVGAVPA